MKKILKNSMIAMLAVFAVSCNVDDVEDRPVVTGIDAPVLEAPEEGNAYVLNPETMDLLAERFVWSAANFGEGIIPQYDLEIDFVGDNFDTPVAIGTTAGALQLAASHNVMNNALLALGATPFEIANFEVRVRAHVGSQELVSNSVEMIITPYSTESPKLYLRGNFLNASGYGADWGDNTNPPFIAGEAFGSTSFEGYIYMNVAAPEFKMIPNVTGFDGDYGDADASGSSGVLSQSEQSNIKLTTGAGYYWVKANTDPEIMTYTATLTNWGVTGSATPNGWPDNGIMDHDMTYDATEKVWKVTLTLSAGELKFRANDAWAINYGDAGGNGVLDFNDGTNIQVTTPGTYLIKLDFSNPRNYTYTLTAQ